MNHLKKLASIRQECISTLSKMPTKNRSPFDRKIIKILTGIDADIYSISKELALISPEHY